MVHWEWVWCTRSGCGALGVGVVHWEWVWCTGSGCGALGVGVVHWEWVWCTRSGCGSSFYAMTDPDIPPQGVLQMNGGLDVFVHTASKYDECQILHVPKATFQ